MQKEIAMTPKLDKNIIFFARLLRASGISIGSDSILEAIESIKLVGIKNKQSFFYALQTCLIKRPEDMKIFAQAFSLFALLHLIVSLDADYPAREYQVLNFFQL